MIDTSIVSRNTFEGKLMKNPIKDLLLIFPVAESYFDVAVVEALSEIEFAYNIWPICLPKYASADINFR